MPLEKYGPVTLHRFGYRSAQILADKILDCANRIFGVLCTLLALRSFPFCRDHWLSFLTAFPQSPWPSRSFSESARYGDGDPKNVGLGCVCGDAEQVKAKSQVVAAGANVDTLAKDSGDGPVIALAVLVEVPGHPGAKAIGPLPKELQVPLPYSAVLSSTPRDEPAPRPFCGRSARATQKRPMPRLGSR
jgi:hypothetical protein